MITDLYDDGEGELLRRIRDTIEVPIAMTIDPHANVSEEMCALANIVVAYKTYPHTDMRETGRRASEILHRTMEGEIAPVTLRVPVAMMEEANSGRTDIGPMIKRIEALRDYEQSSDVLAASIIAGFPADINL